MAWLSPSYRGFAPVVGAALVLSTWVAADGAAAPETGIPTGPQADAAGTDAVSTDAVGADAVGTDAVNADAAAAHAVTLITGDVVEYTRVSGGLPGLAIEPAPAPTSMTSTWQARWRWWRSRSIKSPLLRISRRSRL
jgi:hypothetical protein